MKRFMLLHFGFEKPTPEIMAAWGKWFDSIADKSVENGGFHGGAREISDGGTMAYPWGWNPSRATRSSMPRALMMQKRLLRTIHSLRASGSTKS